MSDHKVREKNRLLSISNEECILVEFTNEDNSIETGFVAWIAEKHKDEIDCIIDEKREIRIFWPTCNISSAATLKKLLSKVDFQEHSVRILARGTWNNIRMKQKNLLKYDIMNPDKKKRKDVVKKAHDDKPSLKGDENSRSMKKKNSSAKGSELLKIVQQKYSSALVAKLNYDDSETENENDKEEQSELEEDDQEESEQKTNDKRQSEKDDVEEIKNDNDNKEELKVKKDTSKALIAKNVEETNMLKNQNEKLVLQIKNTKDKITQLEIENFAFETELNYLKEERKKSQCNENAVNMPRLTKTVLSDLSRIKEIAENCLNYFQNEDDYSRKELNDITNRELPIMNSRVKRSSEYVEKYNGGDKNDKAGCSHWQDSTPSPKRVKKVETKIESNFSKCCNRRIFEINPQIVNNVRKDTLENYVNDLLESLFSAEELAMSSVTGKACNAANNGNVRPALDPVRMQAIEAKVFKKFGDNKSTRTRFRYVAKNKCGAKRLLLKHKKDGGKNNELPKEDSEDEQS